MQRPVAIPMLVAWALVLLSALAAAGDVFTMIEGELIDLNANPPSVVPAPVPVPPMPVPASATPLYDPLPRRLADMDAHDRSALEANPGYDAMPLHEQAGLYARQFQVRHGRFPNFPPPLVEEIRASSQLAGAAPATRPAAPPPPRSPVAEYGRPPSMYDTIKEMYKPPPPKQETPRDVDLGAIPGPWGPGATAPEPVPAYSGDGSTVGPDGTVQDGQGVRLESMRGGWNARSILTGKP